MLSKTSPNCKTPIVNCISNNSGHHWWSSPLLFDIPGHYSLNDVELYLPNSFTTFDVSQHIVEFFDMI